MDNLQRIERAKACLGKWSYDLYFQQDDGTYNVVSTSCRGLKKLGWDQKELLGSFQINVDDFEWEEWEMADYDDGKHIELTSKRQWANFRLCRAHDIVYYRRELLFSLIISIDEENHVNARIHNYNLIV